VLLELAGTVLRYSDLPLAAIMYGSVREGCRGVCHACPWSTAVSSGTGSHP
jgi:hypothetical protein